MCESIKYGGADCRRSSDSQPSDPVMWGSSEANGFLRYHFFQRPKLGVLENHFGILVFMFVVDEIGGISGIINHPEDLGDRIGDTCAARHSGKKPMIWSKNYDLDIAHEPTCNHDSE